MCLTRTYTRIRIQRSGAGVGNNGVRHKASIRQQSTRDFLSRCYYCSYWRQRSKYLKAFTRLNILVYRFKYNDICFKGKRFVTAQKHIQSNITILRDSVV